MSIQTTKPKFLYGTAWKEDRTQELVELAVAQGFRAIDTANQRKHYDEAGVGRAIAAAIESGKTTREDMFLQTKFTYQRGQDHRLPYDPDAPISDQVRQSFDNSLAHLQTTYIDSYILHGPSTRTGLARDDWAAWKAMEEIHASGRTRHLGISNVGLDQLKALCDGASVLPEYVQNRCYASKGWDRDIRAFCAANGIAYQGFSLLTANRAVLKQPELIKIAKRHGKSLNQTLFRFALDVDMVVLTGTTNADHMKADLAIVDFKLSEGEIKIIENLMLA